MLRMLRKKENKGITLIALVVTIIVLLILAGVSISMLTGENGILKRANEAKEKTQLATEDEQRKMAMYEAAMNTENTEYTDPKTNEKITIPAGFAPTRMPGESTVDEGLVITDSEGNEFVWIPVQSEDSYKRNTEYGDENTSINAIDDTNYLPDDLQLKIKEEKKEVDIEKETVLSAGGFYISRYEAGKEENGESFTLVSKKGAIVWNNIKQVECKEEAKKFINNKEVKSGLITGIQWDLVMAFVNNKKDGNGNQFSVDNPSSEGKSDRHIGDLTKSGQNNADKVWNIYDLEGNYFEYVAEMDSRNQYAETHGIFHRRGGRNGSDRSHTVRASFRSQTNGKEGNDKSFRFVLYLV